MAYPQSAMSVGVNELGAVEKDQYIHIRDFKARCDQSFVQGASLWVPFVNAAQTMLVFVQLFASANCDDVRSFLPQGFFKKDGAESLQKFDGASTLIQELKPESVYVLDGFYDAGFFQAFFIIFALLSLLSLLFTFLSLHGWVWKPDKSIHDSRSPLDISPIIP